MNKKQFGQLFTFLEYLYMGNWEYRWGQVPFMDYKSSGNKGESILAHQWSCTALWLLLRYVLPETNKIIDSSQVYEYLIFHDIGEICVGDTPIVQQLKEGSVRKNEIEIREVEAHTEDLPHNLQQLIRSYFHDYTFAHPGTVEIVLARYLNAIQGNHFGLVYGKNLSQYSVIIDKIVSTYFIPLAEQLEKLLFSQSKLAAQEISDLSSYHLDSIRSKGITLNILPKTE
jgi:hypothetical protein